MNSVFVAIVCEKYFIKLNKNIVLFIKDLIEATRIVNRHYLLHLLSVLLFKKCAGIVLRFDFLLYARATLYARLLCGPTFRVWN